MMSNYLASGANFRCLVTDIDFAVEEDWIGTPSPFKHLEFKTRLVCFSIRVDFDCWIVVCTSVICDKSCDESFDESCDESCDESLSEYLV